jgi:hypothetical protein
MTGLGQDAFLGVRITSPRDPQRTSSSFREMPAATLDSEHAVACKLISFVVGKCISITYLYIRCYNFLSLGLSYLTVMVVKSTPPV